MANYLEMARRALAGIAASTETQTTSHEAESTACSDIPVIEVPPANEWPLSLSELAAEIGRGSGDAEGVRREVWLDWCEWKAAALNQLFRNQGVTGQPGRITAATVQHGERKR